MLEAINLRRYEALEKLLSAIQDLLADFQQDRIKCSFECNAMQYGALAKELSCRALMFPRPHIPFRGYSVKDVITSVRGIRDPRWCSGDTSNHASYYDSHCRPHTCKLTSRINPLVKRLEEDLQGLSLDDFP